MVLKQPSSTKAYGRIGIRICWSRNFGSDVATCWRDRLYCCTRWWRQKVALGLVWWGWWGKDDCGDHKNVEKKISLGREIFCWRVQLLLNSKIHSSLSIFLDQHDDDPFDVIMMIRDRMAIFNIHEYIKFADGWIFWVSIFDTTSMVLAKFIANFRQSVSMRMMIMMKTNFFWSSHLLFSSETSISKRPSSACRMDRMILIIMIIAMLVMNIS